MHTWLAHGKQHISCHNHVYILSCKHSSQPIRAHVLSQLFAIFLYPHNTLYMAYNPRQNSWFIFWIAHLNFQLQNLNLTAEFNILHSSLRVYIIGKRFYTCRLAFEFNFFIWPCSRHIFYSLCQITQSNHAIFNSTNKFLYSATFY